MAVISLQDAMDKAFASDFWKLRGMAVQAYASLEQSLCRIFALTSETEFSVAAIIFFKITNADARNAILVKLLKRKYDSKFSPFWNPAIRLLKLIDKRRNEIVHWNTLNTVSANSDGETVIRLTLRPGAAKGFSTDGELSGDDMARFIDDCDYLSRVFNLFGLAVTDEMDPAEAQPWRDAFQQEFVYPPTPGSKLALSKSPAGSAVSQFHVAEG